MKKVFFLVMITSFFLSACGGGESSSSSAVNATLAPVPAEYAGKTNPLGEYAATEGAKVFHSNCEACHGPQGHGDGPAGQALEPKPKNLAELQKVASDDYLFWRISTGRPGSSMVGWSGILTEEQIWQTISLICTLK